MEVPAPSQQQSVKHGNPDKSRDKKEKKEKREKKRSQEKTKKHKRNDDKKRPLVLVTGVTGYIASHIVKILLEKGYRVRGLASIPFLLFLSVD